jgi:hypothetical protein
MTEEEWLTQLRLPQWMVSYLNDQGVSRTKLGRRKFRLFACACCWRIWNVLPDDELREAVRTAEEHADGLRSKEELAAARAKVVRLADDSGPFRNAKQWVHVAIDMAIATTDSHAFSAAFWMTAVEEPLGGVRKTGADRDDTYLCRLLREIFGNPFRPVAFDPSWRSFSVVGLAGSMYESRDFSPMPILADALEEAGCDNPDILAHCRAEHAVHVRGCWVVDLVLGNV